MSQMPPPSAPPMGGSQAPHRGVLVLVLGILSIVICAFIGPFAWMMGKKDLKQIDAGTMDASGRGMTLGGMICGIVGSVFILIWLLYFALIIVALVGAAAAGAAGSMP